MKIGLFFGSFNPIHIGHLAIAQYMASFTDLDKVWLVVSPHNPLKAKSTLINAYDRLEMARLATDSSNQIDICNVEMSLPQPSYTIDTLTYLAEKYPQHTFVLIMGGDNLKTLHKWKNYEAILKYYSIYVYPRPNEDLGELQNHPSIKVTEAPVMQISSTFIRNAIQNKKNIQFLLHPKVFDFIEAKSMYKNKSL